MTPQSHALERLSVYRRDSGGVIAKAGCSGSNDCRRRNISSIGDGGCGSSNNSNSSDRNNSGSMKNAAI